jgi:hypothetical protein
MQFDWPRAAWLLARGTKPADVAAAIGCSRSQLSRRQRHCCLFRALVRQYASAGQAARDGDQTKPVVSRPLADAVRERLEREISDGNTRVALWLAERLRLFSTRHDERATERLQELLEAMSEAERQAFTRPD